MLDLFSGIGGNSYAFHSFAETIMYCEISADATAILNSVMQKKYIDTAPVFGDVTKLSASNQLLDGKIEMISASWPCQGNSSAGLRKGMDDHRSGLIRDVFRLIDECGKNVSKLQPDIIFLENVTGVQKTGSIDYIEQECAKIDYECTWTMLSASDIGFQHERERFYCVAVKNTPEATQSLLFALQTSETSDSTHLRTFSLPAPARMIRTMDGTSVSNTKRLTALGNSVVPFGVKTGFERLARRILLTRGHAPTTTVPLYQIPTYLPLVLDPTSYERHKWHFTHGKCAGMLTEEQLQKGDIPQMFHKNARQTAQIHQKPIEKKLWFTPRSGNSGACHVLTTRSAHDLGTQLRFEKDTPDEVRGGATNAQFVEHLMGFPTDFTDYSLKRKAAV